MFISKAREKEDKSSIPQCITSNNIINVRTLKSHHFDMHAQSSKLAECWRFEDQDCFIYIIADTEYVSELTGSRLPFLKSKCYACELSTFSFEAAIAIEWLFIFSANDYSITLCYSAYAQWWNIVCTIHKHLVNEAGNMKVIIILWNELCLGSLSVDLLPSQRTAESLNNPPAVLVLLTYNADYRADKPQRH